jgi:hypothetical protein
VILLQRLRRDVAPEMRAVEMNLFLGGAGGVHRWFRSVDRFGASGYLGFVRHELTDEISLTLGRRVAERLSRQPELLRIARENLDRWAKLNADAPSLLRCYAEWREILERPVEEICRVLNSNSEEARRLRQNSPFAGVLSPREVWELKRSFRHETAAA